MAPHEILATVRRTPFEPFRLVLSDGAKHEIRHADQCMVMKRDVMIGLAAPGSDFVEYTLKINCYNVRAVEPMAREACAASA
jgi:hypothetical protein